MDKSEERIALDKEITDLKGFLTYLENNFKDLEKMYHKDAEPIKNAKAHIERVQRKLVGLENTRKRVL